MGEEEMAYYLDFFFGGVRRILRENYYLSCSEVRPKRLSRA